MSESDHQSVDITPATVTIRTSLLLDLLSMVIQANDGLSKVTSANSSASESISKLANVLSAMAKSSIAEQDKALEDGSQ